jgi:hypothetical protein
LLRIERCSKLPQRTTTGGALEPLSQYSRESFHARGQTSILVSVGRILAPANRQDPLLDPEQPVEGFRLEQETPGGPTTT